VHTLRACPAQTSRADARIRTQTGELVDLKTTMRDPARAEIEILCGEFEFRGRRRGALLDALPDCRVVEFAQRPGLPVGGGVQPGVRAACGLDPGALPAQRARSLTTSFRAQSRNPPLLRRHLPAWILRLRAG
jgi:hypothetical protein